MKLKLNITVKQIYYSMAFADSFKLKCYVEQFNFGNVQGIQDKLSRIACQAMFLWEAFRLPSFSLACLAPGSSPDGLKAWMTWNTKHELLTLTTPRQTARWTVSKQNTICLLKMLTSLQPNNFGNEVFCKTEQLFSSQLCLITVFFL